MMEVTELLKWKKQNLNLWLLTHHAMCFLSCCVLLSLPFFSIEP